MVALVKLRLADGTELFVEADDPAEATRGGGLPDAAGSGVDFGASLAAVKQAASELFEALRSMDVRPDNCEIEFGVKIVASAGAILARAGGEANFTVKMAWTNLKETPPASRSPSR